MKIRSVDDLMLGLRGVCWRGLINVGFKKDIKLGEAFVLRLIRVFGLQLYKSKWLALGAPFRYMEIRVPVGEENYWVGVFKRMKIVEYAMKSPVISAL